MRQTLTISLPEKLKNEVDVLVKEDGINRSDLIRESLKDYIYFRKLRKLRDKMIIKAQKNGIFTNQDVYDRVSWLFF